VILVEDIRMLRFRWEDKEYGIAMEDVIGITNWTWVNSATNPVEQDQKNNSPGNPIPILCMQGGFINGKNKQAVIVNGHGVEIVLIVDEVLTVSKLTDEVVVGITQASFKIWQF
jgi:chemotaxis signal transduction protein